MATAFVPLNIPAAPLPEISCCDRIRDTVSILFRAICNTVAAIWNWAIGLFAENEARRNILNRFEERLERQDLPPVEQLYFRELREKISETSPTQDPTALCQSYERTSESYRHLVERVEQAAGELTGNPVSKDEADHLYQGAMDELDALQNEPLTDTERAIYKGRITRAFLAMDEAFAGVQAKPLHRYCGCNILEEGENQKRGVRAFAVPYPEEIDPDSTVKGRAAVQQSWSLGGGHNVAQHGMAQRLAEAGMHSYHVQADKETLRPFDKLYRLSDGRYSDADLLMYLMRNNCWRTLRFINWLCSGKPNAEIYQKTIDQFSRSMLERGVPDLQMTIYARNTGAAVNAAGQLGAAAIHVETDMCSQFFDIEKPSDIQNPHFADAAMVEGDKLLGESRKRLGDDRIFLTGFPVRKAFLQNYDLDALRAERGIAPDARVIILSSGGQGVENGYAQYIVKEYQKGAEDLSKIHLVVLCGKNEQKKAKLEAAFQDLNHPKIAVQVKGWIEEDELGKLNAMAADPENGERRGVLISTKGGGGTLSEGLASGVPMLLSSRNDVDWEKVNIDYVCEQGCGLQFTDDADMMKQMKALFQMPYHRIEVDSMARSVELIQDVIARAEADNGFVALREGALEFAPPEIVV